MAFATGQLWSRLAFSGTGHSKSPDASPRTAHDAQVHIHEAYVGIWQSTREQLDRLALGLRPPSARTLPLRPQQPLARESMPTFAPKAQRSRARSGSELGEVMIQVLVEQMAPFLSGQDPERRRPAPLKKGGPFPRGALHIVDQPPPFLLEVLLR
jgi:hypothetical protein